VIEIQCAPELGPWAVGHDVTVAGAVHLPEHAAVARVLAITVPSGDDPGKQTACFVETLGAAVRGAGFAVPGALGVQEGGLILICGLFAIPPDVAIALSMVKRARELIVGIPGLLVWQWTEGRHIVRRKKLS